MGDARTVYVGNVSSNVSEDVLRSLFSNCGLVTHVRTAGKRGLNTVYCFVEFADPRSAEMAVSFNGLRVGDREIRVSLAKPGGPSRPVPFTQDLPVPLNYVQAEAQARLLQYSTFHLMLNQSNIQTVNAVKPHKKPRHDPTKVMRTIYIEGVGADATEQQLVRVFTKFGGIKALRLTEKSGSGARRAWIEFDSTDAANKAKSVGTLEMGPQSLKVSASMTAIHTSTLVMTADDLSDAVMASPEKASSVGTGGQPTNPSETMADDTVTVEQKPPAENCGGSHSPNLSRSSTNDVLGSPDQTKEDEAKEGDEGGGAGEEGDSGNEGAA
eukprot:jgi/Botrbrau1/829/Bobra.0352s0026.1